MAIVLDTYLTLVDTGPVKSVIVVRKVICKQPRKVAAVSREVVRKLTFVVVVGWWWNIASTAGEDKALTSSPASSPVLASPKKMRWKR